MPPEPWHTATAQADGSPPQPFRARTPSIARRTTRNVGGAWAEVFEHLDAGRVGPGLVLAVRQAFQDPRFQEEAWRPVVARLPPAPLLLADLGTPLTPAAVLAGWLIHLGCLEEAERAIRLGGHFHSESAAALMYLSADIRRRWGRPREAMICLGYVIKLAVGQELEALAARAWEDRGEVALEAGAPREVARENWREAGEIYHRLGRASDAGRVQHRLLQD